MGTTKCQLRYRVALPTILITTNLFKWTEEEKEVVRKINMVDLLSHLIKYGEVPGSATHLATSWPLTDPRKAPCQWFQSVRGQLDDLGHHVPDSPQSVDVETIFGRVLARDTILCCERCGQLYDADFELIDQHSQLEPIPNYTLSFVLCERNGNGDCEKNATAVWASGQKLIDCDSQSTVREFAKIFARYSPSLIAGSMGWGWSFLSPNETIRVSYLAWRKIWHSLVFRPSIDGPIEEELKWVRSTVASADIAKLKLWGDLRGDFCLYECGLLSANDLAYTYEQSPAGIRYLIETPGWEEELEWLNIYAGRRRSMGNAQFNLAKRAVQRASTAMNRLLNAERALFRKFTTAKLEIKEEMRKVAANRFREVYSAVAVPELMAETRIAEKTCPRLGITAHGPKGGKKHKNERRINNKK